jgi:ABC-type multidrug transport system fused ATPase/permease subunit
MLNNIWKENKFRISFSYFLLILEFFLFALLPFFMGRSVDAIVNNNYKDFWVYLAACLFSLIAGFVRRRFDSRAFLRIWSKKANDTITRLMISGMDSTKIVSRTHMVREFAWFFENTVPAIIQALIEIAIAVTMLSLFTPYVGLTVLILVLVATTSSYLYAVKLMHIETICQKQREEINKCIISGNKEEVTSGYEGQRANYVRFADWEGYSWASY